MILCPGTLPPDEWRYSPKIDGSVDLFFATVASRFLESMYGTWIWQVSKDSAFPPEGPTEKLQPRATFNKPAGEILSSENFDDWLLGLFWHRAREVDTKMVDDYRNFLATNDTGVPSGDQLALNIQQARDFGLPMYNDAREALGLPR